MANERYFRNHGEIKEMIKMFIEQCLKAKPDDTVSFAADFFCDHLLPQNAPQATTQSKAEARSKRPDRIKNLFASLAPWNDGVPKCKPPPTKCLDASRHNVLGTISLKQRVTSPAAAASRSMMATCCLSGVRHLAGELVPSRTQAK